MGRTSRYSPEGARRLGRRARCFAICMILGFAWIAWTSGLQTASASRATSDEMERVCQNWLAYIVHQQGTWAGVTDPEIIGVDDVIQDGVLLARSYSIAPRGHVVVPILRELTPIKAYSEESNLDLTPQVGFPQLLRDDLGPQVQLFAELFGSLNATQPDTGLAPFDPANVDRWQRLGADPETFAAQLQTLGRGRSLVGPLLTTAWHQADPYNQLCPSGDLSCTSCPSGPPIFPSCVGCVATAVSQVMKYHNWPPYGGQGHSYLWQGDRTCGPSTPPAQLIAFFSDPYDWANMPDNTDQGYTPEQAAALSEICYEVGVSIDMDYGVCASGATLPAVQQSLPRYFLYDSGIQLLTRGNFPDLVWWILIRAEIDAHRPIVYTLLPYLRDPHALVVDGYTDDPSLIAPYRYGVHLNFGWGTAYLGWYALDAPSVPGGSWPGCNKPTEQMLTHIMPAAAAICLVKPDGTGDYATIQAALDAMPNGSIIELDDGTYSGAGNWDLYFRGKSLTVRSRSGHAEDCVIDCEDPQRHRAVIFNTHEGPGAILQGISMVNGDAWDNGGGSGYGGAIYCENACPRIEHCIFHNNVGYAAGAIMGWLTSGLPAGLPGDRVKILGCTFSDNTATTAAGGAIAFSQCPAELDSCVFSGNTASVAGALFVQDRFDSTLIRRCTFSANSAEQQGAAIWRHGDGPEATFSVASCTFYGNDAGNGVIYSEPAYQPDGPLLMDGTIVAFNAAAAFVCDGATTPQLACCDLYGNTGGDYADCVAGQNGQNGNISEDPLFVDPAQGDLGLQLDSPCAPAHSGTCGLIGSSGTGDVADVLSHDIGNCVLSVTDQGTLGFLDGAHSRGSGFVYPAGGANLLYIGGLWVGQDTSYVANHDYDADPGSEWTVSADPDGRLRIEESGYCDQEFRGSCTDSGAVSPLDLFVGQQSSAWGEDETRDDFVILHYTLANHGSGALHGLYAGVFLDLDLSSSGRSDHGDTEPLLHLAYLTDASGICAGVCLLEDVPGGSPQGNLTLISNPTYVWPHSYVTDRDKFGFLSAGGPEYVVESASTPDDYGVLVSVGPFDLAPGEERAVSFAIVGGSDLNALEENARTARGIGSEDVADESGDRLSLTRLLPGRPNPFRSAVQISFHLAQPGEADLSVYDVSGRRVRTLARGWQAAVPQTVTWDSRDETGHAVANGIYFARLRAGEREQQQRLVLLR